MYLFIRFSLLLAMVGALFAASPEASSWSSGTLPAVGTRDPYTLDEVIISESFDMTPNGGLPLGWAEADLDSGFSYSGAPFYGGRTIWQGLSRVGFSTHTGLGTSANAYNATPPLTPNDDWLILPRLDSLVGPITLSYWVSSQDAANLESFEVRVSASDARPISFAHVIRTVSQTPHMWTQYTDNLTEFAGAHFYVAIHYNSNNKYVIKVDDVLLTATRPNAVVERPAAPYSFAFDGNYPNPFNGQTEFRFDLAHPGSATLDLFDILGQRVARIIDGYLTAGPHTASFDAHDLPSGIYIARLTTGHGSALYRKAALIR